MLLSNLKTIEKNNVIIRNFPESENENLLNKVSGLLKDGLRLRNVGIHCVQRKKSLREGKPGVVIVKFKNMQEKRKVMEVKKNLKDSRNFREVFIENDLPISERLLNANLRRIVNTIGREKLEIRGKRVQIRSDERITNDRDDVNRRGYEHRHNRNELVNSNNRRDNKRRDNTSRYSDKNTRQFSHRENLREYRRY